MRNSAHGRIHKSLIEIEIGFCFESLLRVFSASLSVIIAFFYSDSLGNCFTLPHSFRMGLFRALFSGLGKVSRRGRKAFQESKITYSRCEKVEQSDWRCPVIKKIFLVREPRMFLRIAPRRFPVVLFCLAGRSHDLARSRGR